MVNKVTFPYANDSLKGVEGVSCIKCDGAAVVHIESLSQYIENKRESPAKFEGFLLLLCTRGSVKFTSYFTELELSENTFFIAPSSMLQFKSCDNCELYIVALDREFASLMNIDFRMIQPIHKAFVEGGVVLTVQPQYIEGVRRFFSVMYDRSAEGVSDVQRIYREMSMRHMLASITYWLFEVISSQELSSSPIATKGRNSEYFNRLVSLLLEHYRVERGVEFYADKMNITPKHLSRVVRAFSGKSVHRWIDEFVVLEIKNLLRNSELSIQQISYELNFPNPSFMGQYFKRITGQTPGEYRRGI